MNKFDYEELDKAIKEWNNLYCSLMKLLDETGFEIKAPLYTMVKTGPHEYEKFRIKCIKKEKNIWLTEPHMTLICENLEDELEIPVYKAFELKTDGKICDIIIILMFIKDQIKNSKVIETETIII